MHRRYLEIAIDICGNQSKLAETVGVDRSEITRYLHGTRKIPAKVALKIARFLTEDPLKQMEILSELSLNENAEAGNDEGQQS
jgi:plasmid maintenance system antidote protein VapI